MNSWLKSLVPSACAASALLSPALAIGFNDSATLDSKGTEAAITALTSKVLESSQFAHQELDAALADKFFERFLDSLDAAHLTFLQSDVEEFARFTPSLAKATRVDGDSQLAHLVFKRYIERLDQRVAYVTGLLESETFEFTSDDSFAYDRKDAPRPENLLVAKALWKQQLRYEYLQEKLAGKDPAEIVKTLSRRSGRVVETMRKLPRSAVLEIYLQSLAQVYDPHSDYMGPEQLKSFEIAMNLSLIGIGASLQSDDGYCKIMDLVPGGPAARSGLLKTGDRIVGVAQKAGDDYADLIDLPLSQAVDLIRGKKGTPVFLNIIPSDAPDDSLRKPITIVRDEIRLEDQQAKAQIIDLPSDGKIRRVGVINLPAFYAGEGSAKSGPTSATADVKRLLAKLKKENITGLILDLRRNGGGSLQEAIDLTGLFIPSGPVVQTRDMQGKLDIGRDRDGVVDYDGPLVVLTSRLSASASEIVAGALQDYGRALVVGDTSTFGKGTVQTIVPLSRVMQGQGIIPNTDPGALKVTISKFYRPSGKSTQLEGVKADIVIPSPTDLPEIGEADMENPLPWDTIESVRYTPQNRVSQSIPILQKRSESRLKVDADFKELTAEIIRFQKMRDDKSVSLNEATRRNEKADLKARAELVKKERLARNPKMPDRCEITLKTLSVPGPGERYKPAVKPKVANNSNSDEVIDTEAIPYDELILKEAGDILVDYSNLLAGQPVVSQR